MTALAKPTLQSPKLSEQSYKEVVNWVKQGDCVILHMCATSAQVYHKCVVDTQGKHKEAALDKIRVIAVDVGPFYSDLILDSRKWPALLKQAGCTQCACSLKDRVVVTTKVDVDLGKMKFHAEEISVPKEVPNVWSFCFST